MGLRNIEIMMMLIDQLDLSVKRMQMIMMRTT